MNKIWDVDEFVSDYKSNMTLEEIKTKYGLKSIDSVTSMATVFRKKGCNIPHRKYCPPKKDWSEFVNDFNNNIPMEDLYGKYGYTSRNSAYVAIYKMSQREGVLLVKRNQFGERVNQRNKKGKSREEQHEIKKLIQQAWNSNTHIDEMVKMFEYKSKDSFYMYVYKMRQQGWEINNRRGEHND